MSLSLNKIQLIGNLGQDAEVRFTNNNVEVISFSMATTHSYKDKNDDWVNETEWHNITAFKLSNYVKDGLKKGNKVYVEGRKKTEEWEKDGKKYKSVKIIATSIIPLSDNKGSQSDNGEVQHEAQITENKDDDLPF